MNRFFLSLEGAPAEEAVCNNGIAVLYADSLAMGRFEPPVMFNGEPVHYFYFEKLVYRKHPNTIEVTVNGSFNINLPTDVEKVTLFIDQPGKTRF